MTLNGQASVQITANINITNQSLTINSTNPYALYVYGTSTNSWQANFTLGSACTMDVETNCALNLIGPIGGSGGVTKIGQGRLVYAGTNNNTYAGLTTVNQGELDLAKSGGVVVLTHIPGEQAIFDSFPAARSAPRLSVTVPAAFGFSGATWPIELIFLAPNAG